MSEPDLAALAAGVHRPGAPWGVALARFHAGAVSVATAGPVAPDAAFELGSITKAVTGLLLADAVVRGEVTLETPLAACLPGARRDPALSLEALAAHTAGLPRVPLALLRRIGPFERTDPYAATTVPELVADLGTVRLRRPGAMRYSNLGAALLGQALAARAGVPYEELARARVLEPLGLDELWLTGGREPAQPHGRRGRPVPPWTLGAYAPAGGLRGTVRGALALATACLAPPPALREAVALALTPRARKGPMASGLGWQRAPAGRERVVWWHNGGTNGSRAFTGFDPERGEAVAAAASAARSPDAAARAAFSA